MNKKKKGRTDEWKTKWKKKIIKKRGSGKHKKVEESWKIIKIVEEEGVVCVLGDEKRRWEGKIGEEC